MTSHSVAFLTHVIQKYGLCRALWGTNVLASHLTVRCTQMYVCVCWRVRMYYGFPDCATEWTEITICSKEWVRTAGDSNSYTRTIRGATCVYRTVSGYLWEKVLIIGSWAVITEGLDERGANILWKINKVFLYGRVKHFRTWVVIFKINAGSDEWANEWKEENWPA